MEFLNFFNKVSFFNFIEEENNKSEYCFFTDSDLIDDKNFIFSFLKKKKV